MKNFKLLFLYREIDFMKIMNKSVDEIVAVYDGKTLSNLKLA